MASLETGNKKYSLEGVLVGGYREHTRETIWGNAGVGARSF